MILIDGKKVATEIQQELAEKISQLPGRKPCLAVVIVGEHPASQIYVKRKIQACSEVGIISICKKMSQTVSESELLHEIDHLNEDPAVDGILVQLPLPMHINVGMVIKKISPKKDVDGFHPMNVGKMFCGETDGFFPCTPLAIKTLLDSYQIEVSGRHVVVFGRSNIVGKPIAAMLMQSMPGGNATVTVAHRQSINIKSLSALADILIVAIGQPKFITADMVKEKAVIIDVGINRIFDGSTYKLVGDVDFEGIKDKCSYITPVPGGVGPMTIAMLLKNTLQSRLKE